MSEELTLGSHDSLTAKHSFLIWNTQSNVVNFTFVVPTPSYRATQLKHIPEKSSMQHTQAPVFRLNALCLSTWLQLGWKSEAGCAALHTATIMCPSWYSLERDTVNNKQCYRKSKAFVIIQELLRQFLHLSFTYIRHLKKMVQKLCKTI